VPDRLVRDRSFIEAWAVSPPDDPKRRGFMSDDQRAVIGRARVSPVKGVPVLPETWEDQDTGQVDVEARKRIRNDRPTEKRFEKLEEFKDDAIQSFNELKVAIANTNTAIAKTNAAVEEVRGDHKATSATLSRVEKYLDAAQRKELAEFEANKGVEAAEKKDAIDARKTKRDTIAKIFGGLLGGGLLFKILQHFGVL
jgi:hypothetical protein